MQQNKYLGPTVSAMPLYCDFSAPQTCTLLKHNRLKSFLETLSFYAFFANQIYRTFIFFIQQNIILEKEMQYKNKCAS